MKFNGKDRRNMVLEGYIRRQEIEQMQLDKKKASSPLRHDEREALGILVENSNWLGPGKLQTIIEEYY